MANSPHETAHAETIELQDLSADTSVSIQNTAQEETAAQAEDETQYPQGSKLIFICTALVLVLVIIGLDNTIIATAVPTITDHFKTIADVGWYYSIYRLLGCAFQFMFGRFYTVFSVKKVFLITLVIFEGGCLLAGLAPSSKALVVGRAISGFGASGLISGVFVLFVQTIPLRRRPTIAAVGGSAELIASIAAPLLGGVITQHLSWRWCFFINLPLGAVSFLIIAVFCQNPRENTDILLPWRDKLKRLDLLGTALFVPATISLLLALQFGGSKYGWGDARIIVLLTLFVALIAAFTWLQWHLGDAATLPTRIIGQRSIWSGMWYIFCVSGALSVFEYYLPIYFQTAKQASPIKSGVLVLPTVIAITISVLLAGPATTYFGYYSPFMLISTILCPIAAGLLTTLTVDTSPAKLICLQALLGFGCGIGYLGPQLAAQTVLEAKDVPMGISVIVFAQNFGPAFFVAVAQTIFSGRLAADVKLYAPGIDPSTFESMGFSGLGSQIRTGNGTGALVSYDKAIAQTFYLPLTLTCLTLLGSAAMEWTSVKTKRS